MAMKENKDEFIAKYLDKEMKDHGLPYGLAYYHLLNEKIKKAELAWERHIKKYD